MEKVVTIVDEKANKELTLSTRIFVCILAGLGGFGIGFYLMYSIFKREGGWNDPLNITLCVLGIFFIIVALFFDYKITKAIKLAKANPVKTITEFNDDYLVMESYKGEEKVAESKLEYKSFKRYSVKKNFVFMVTDNNITLAFTKSDELVDFISKTGIKKL